MITIIFGNPGAGKTKLMTMHAVERMRPPLSYDLLKISNAKSKEYINGGHNFSLPQKHVVFTDYGVRAVGLGYAPRISYYVDGFRLGLPNNKHDTMLLPYGAQVFLSEAQKYFNSRMSNYFSEFISWYYATHRHYGLNFWLDCQRHDLIDLNIRAIADCFIEVLSTSDKYDRYGNVVFSSWNCRIFKSANAVDRYLKTGNLSECENKKFTFKGNIFNCYNSYYFEKLHLKDREFMDYTLIKSPSLGSDIDSVRKFNDLYSCEVPKTFYTKRGEKSG